MKTEVNGRFLQFLDSLDRKPREAVFKAIEKFTANPSLPGLKLEKLAGFPNRWSIRVSIHTRLLLSKTVDEDGMEVWIFIDGGSHQVYRHR